MPSRKTAAPTPSPAAAPATPAAKAPTKTAPKAPAKTPAKTVAKTAAKVAAKPAAPAKAPAAAPANAVKAVNVVKADKPVSVVKADKPAKAEKTPKPAKAPKPHDKPVRDSFTMPEADFALIAALKQRALGARRETKKSELLRAGLHALAAMDTPALMAALGKLAPVKIGRPKKGH
jgi:hypothetical protein